MIETVKGRGKSLYKRRKPLSAEHKKNISESCKNRIGRKWTDEEKKKIGESRKGMKFTEEHRKHLSESHKGNIQTIEQREKRSNSMKGRIVSEETRRKISIKHRGKRKPWTSGERSNSWKGGITPENLRIRKSMEYVEWRRLVFERDDFTCQKTNQKGGMVAAHHIKNFSDFPELRFDVNNGITLSQKSHIQFHKIYGVKNNTREQLEEYLTKQI